MPTATLAGVADAGAAATAIVVDWMFASCPVGGVLRADRFRIDAGQREGRSALSSKSAVHPDTLWSPLHPPPQAVVPLLLYSAHLPQAAILPTRRQADPSIGIDHVENSGHPPSR